MKFGVIEECIPELRSYDFETVCGNIVEKEYPEEYEIPRQNTGTLKNQGDVGACVACVGSQIAEGIYNIQLLIDSLKSQGYSDIDIENFTDDKIDELLNSIISKEEMSEGFFYGALRSDDTKRAGMITSEAMNYWQKIGIVPKTYYDLLMEMPEQRESINKIPQLYEIASKYKIGGYVRINYANKEKRDLAVKQALTKYPRIKQFPLLAVSNKGFSEPHCILLTGWNDKTNKYKIKNSWGEKYGDKGFSEINKDKINDIYVIIPEDIKMNFEDIKETDWFFDEIKHMYAMGLANGVSNNKFEPHRSPTRAEMFTLGYRIIKMIDDRLKILNKVLNEKIQ